MASSCPLTSLSESCPLTGSSSKSATSSSTERKGPPSITDFLDGAERRVLEQAGLTQQPLACQAAETAIDSLVRQSCDELGSLTVNVNASSSAGLLLRGELLSASIEASAIAAAGLRASRLSLSSPGIDFDLPISALLDSPADFLRAAGDASLLRPPNLKSPATVGFDVTLTQDDINRSPVLFGALQEILRELLTSGVSAAIGEALPRDRSALVVSLVRVEAPQDGKLVLVADAEATQADGNVLRLSGMRIRTTPRADAASRLVVLDRPELLSSFEGFGAKVEVGLPFLRAAGVPLPDDISLSSLVVDGGSIMLEGKLTIRPVDYDSLLASAQAAAASASAAAASREEQERTRDASRWSSDAVAVDVDAVAEDDERYTDDERAALRLPPSPR